MSLKLSDWQTKTCQVLFFIFWCVCMYNAVTTLAAMDDGSADEDCRLIMKVYNEKNVAVTSVDGDELIDVIVKERYFKGEVGGEVGGEVCYPASQWEDFKPVDYPLGIFDYVSFVVLAITVIVVCLIGMFAGAYP